MTTTLLAYIPSPSQGVWHVFGVPLRAYALFIIIGIIAALVLGDRRWVARGGEPGVVYDIALWAVPFGLVGGRLYHVITDWRTYFGEDGAGFGAALRIWDGGLGIWGAVALGAVGAWIGCRLRGIPLPAFGDAIAPGIILAQAIGRLGNYFNQELFGRETTLPWGLKVYERVNAAGVPDSLNGVSTGELVKVVHPTFLYELLWNLLVFAALIYIDRRFKIGHGRLFAIYVAGYCVGRFWIELMRSDTATLLAGIRINSFTSTFVFIGAVVYIMAAPKGREDPSTLLGKQDVEADEDSDVEDFVKGLAVAASTTGVVAAAKVAGEGDDEKSEAEVAEAESPDADVADEHDSEAGGLGSVDGDELVEAAEGASVVHDAVVEGEAHAAALAADVDAEPDESDADESEPDDVAEPVESVTEDIEPAEPGGLGSVEGDELAEAAEGASILHDAVVEGDAEADADAESEPDGDAGSESVAEAVEGDAEGLGSVEGDEVAEAVEDAPEAYEVAVDGEAEAEALAEDVAAESASAESVSEVDDVAIAEPEGLGSVEGDEVAEAVEDATEAHEVAVDGEAEAEALAEDVAAEPAGEAPAGAVDDEPEAEASAEDVEAEAESEGEPAESVSEVDAVAIAESEGEPSAEAETVDGEAEAESDDNAEPESVPESAEPEGLGSVEGDEVAEAVEDAPEAHAIVVEDEADAEDLAEDVEADSEPEGDEVAEAVEGAPDAHEVAVEGEADAEDLADEVESEPGEPVSEAQAVAVEGDAVPEALEASEFEAESEKSGSAEAEPAGGGDDDAAEPEDVPDAEVVEAEGASVIEALDAESADEDHSVQNTTASVESPSRGVVAESASRVRQWVRRRRNR